MTTDRAESVQLAVVLTEFGNEITQHFAELETPDEQSILIELLGAYIKMGFNQSKITIETNSITLEYNPVNNKIIINNDFRLSSNAPKWGEF